MIWFVLGPSGVGKSHFGKYLAENKDWFHREIDQFDKSEDGIDMYELRRDWDAYCFCYNPSGLLKELKERTKKSGKINCVLTFPGNLILYKEHISAVAGSIKIIYLYGPEERCISAFLKREQETNRNLDLKHWKAYNCDSYCTMSKPEFEANRVHVWTHNGERRQPQAIYDEVSNWNKVANKP